MTDTYEKQSVTAETAQKMVSAAVAKAQDIGVPMVVAVLDESGLLKAFCRMDGAPLVSIDVAQNVEQDIECAQAGLDAAA